MKWIIADTQHAEYENALMMAKADFAESHPKNILSVRLSNDGTKAVFKLDVEDMGNIPQAFQSGILAVYTKETHGELQTLLQGSEWTTPQD